MKKIVLSFIVCISLAFADDIDTVEKTRFIALKHNIDFDAKSNKGWLRVLNSPKKRSLYELYLTEEELFLLKAYLTQIRAKRSRSLR